MSSSRMCCKFVFWEHCAALRASTIVACNVHSTLSTCLRGCCVCNHAATLPASVVACNIHLTLSTCPRPDAFVYKASVVCVHFPTRTHCCLMQYSSDFTDEISSRI
eukprot:gnl/TRDRNA2_/TRDRNA2_136205_c0_seq2.p1 gnl/TRDRNA2_/TRDRNA2_136205_c0~~gnl/TRDRNA2_/TRDRNA2_136205_c0_seq2.p1  ORF type:complete len:106 (-),score=3.89 gnl/TRDRNA2_/TRDRNA2_136205_c0_seq2:35-352(-)